MADDPVAKPTARLKILKTVPKPAEREQSTIGFPYNDMETAISIARAIHDAGAAAVTREQLAGLLGTTTSSGTFLNKLSATRMFGLITLSAGRVELTDLGFSILDSEDRRARKARADAFLNVPLFRKLYEDFRGRQLPPRPLGLEQAIMKAGVSNNQKTTARLTFDKSATQAGFFPNGSDRLIEPIIGGLSPARGVPIETASDDDGTPDRPIIATTNIGGDEHHPFIQGLIDTLPQPETNWTVEGRAKWLQAAANIFDLIYKGDGSITIQTKAGNGGSKED